MQANRNTFYQLKHQKKMTKIEKLITVIATLALCVAFGVAIFGTKTVIQPIQQIERVGGTSSFSGSMTGFSEETQHGSNGPITGIVRGTIGKNDVTGVALRGEWQDFWQNTTGTMIYVNYAQMGVVGNFASTSKQATTTNPYRLYAATTTTNSATYSNTANPTTTPYAALIDGYVIATSTPQGSVPLSGKLLQDLGMDVRGGLVTKATSTVMGFWNDSSNGVSTTSVPNVITSKEGSNASYNLQGLTSRSLSETFGTRVSPIEQGIVAVPDGDYVYFGIHNIATTSALFICYDYSNGNRCLSATSTNRGFDVEWMFTYYRNPS